MNESRRLKEVWKWKEDVFTKTRNMDKNERISFFNKGLENFMKKTGLKLKIVCGEDIQVSDSRT